MLSDSHEIASGPAKHHETIQAFSDRGNAHHANGYSLSIPDAGEGLGGEEYIIKTQGFPDGINPETCVNLEKNQ
jgi:hypothetical protein